VKNQVKNQENLEDGSRIFRVADAWKDVSTARLLVLSRLQKRPSLVVAEMMILLKTFSSIT